MAACTVNNALVSASRLSSVEIAPVSSSVVHSSKFVNRGSIAPLAVSAGNTCRHRASRLQVRAVAATGEVDVATLDTAFGAEGVKVDAGEGGLTRVTLSSSSGSVAEVYLYGGVATSWQLPSGEDLLFVRPDAVYTGKKPISGGLTQCWPQFGPGAIQQHGFARNSTWEIVSTTGGPSPSVTIRLPENEYTRGMWDFSFDTTFTVTLGETTLSTELAVKNTDSKPFHFTSAIHSYFRGAIADLKVYGLKGLKYLNKDPDPVNPTPGVEEREAVTFSAYVDSVYLDTPSELLLENGLGNTVVIANQGWKDAVVWSPYLTMEACYKDFVCVENAQIEPVTLQPGESWTAQQTLSPK